MATDCMLRARFGRTAVTKENSGGRPLARRAMTETGLYLCYAPRRQSLVRDGAENLAPTDTVMAGQQTSFDIISNPASARVLGKSGLPEAGRVSEFPGGLELASHWRAQVRVGADECS
jgi:hypothetical protein